MKGIDVKEEDGRIGITASEDGHYRIDLRIMGGRVAYCSVMPGNLTDEDILKLIEKGSMDKNVQGE